MYLEIGETTKENARKSDVLDAIPSRAPSEDWHILVSHDDDNSIEAEGRADGRFGVTYFAGSDIFHTVEPLDGRDLRLLLADYADGNERWRTGRSWKRFELPRSAAPLTFWLSAQAVPFLMLGGILAVVFLGPVAWRLLAVDAWVAAIPLPSGMDSTASRLILGFLAICVLIFAIAATVKMVEVRRASRWPSTFGTIVRSEAGFELKTPPGGGMPANRRVPKVAYEFTVAGKAYSGDRITLAEVIAEDEIGGILKRYPVGSAVQVYYDPSNPGSSVLERDAPAGLGLGCLALLVAAGVGATAVMWLATSGADFLQRALPHAFLPVMILTAIGSLALLIAFAAARRAHAASLRWPKTTGTIVSSGTTSFRTGSSSGGARTAHMPLVEYSYTVAGQVYSSRAIRHGTEVGGSEAYAQKIAAAYPVGRMVAVHYDPADPSRAALELGGGWYWVLLILGIGLAVTAVLTSGILAV